MNQRGFSPIIILGWFLLLALIAGGAYYFAKSPVSTPVPTQTTTSSQTPASSSPAVSSIDTSNWKTYTNPINHFSIEYPPAAFINPQVLLPSSKPGLNITVDNSSGVNVSKTSQIRFSDMSELYFSLTVSSTSGQASEVDNYASALKSQPGFTNITKLVFSGQSALSYEASAINTKIIYFIYNHQVYILTISQSPEDKSIADQIASTFKFTN